MGMDPLYLILAAPALILSMIFSAKVKSTFAKYSKVGAASGMTGAEAAATMLSRAGVNDVMIRKISGVLTDHYNPADNTLNLSPEVYEGRSLSSLGVACHEAGHALQKATGYKWMGVRSALVPAANLGSKFSYVVFAIGLAEAADAAGNPADAARNYMTVAVLFDDPELTPRALSRAAALYAQLGKPAERAAAESDLRSRYPRSSFALSLPPAE